MRDFIDRRALLMYLADIQFGGSPSGRVDENKDRQEGVFIGLEDAIQAVEGMPAANVRPLEPGRWEKTNPRPNSYLFKCSICGGTAYQVTGNNGRKEKVVEPICTYRFCPNCGAHMLVKRTEINREVTK